LEVNGNAHLNYSLIGRGIRSSNRGELHLNATSTNDVSEIFFGHGDGHTEGNIRWAISDRGFTDGRLDLYRGPAFGGFSAIQSWDENGYVGIGTTSPEALLDIGGGDGTPLGTQFRAVIKGTSSRTLYLDSDSSGASMWWGSGNTPHFAIDSISGGGAGFWTYSGGWSQRLTINSSGNVGIGTTSPSQKLHVVGNTITTGVSYTDIVQTYSGSSIDFRHQDASVVMRVDTPNARVGIGTTTPAYQLDIKNSSNATARLHAGANSSASLRLQNDAQHFDVNLQTNDKFAIYDHTAGTQPFTILPTSGNVGIGTVSPSEKLDVSGNAKILGRLYVNLSGENSRFNSLDANGPYVSFRNNGTAKGYIGSAYHLWVSPNNLSDNFAIRAENRLDFGIAANVKMTLNSSGNFGIGTTSPSAKLEVAATATTSVDIAHFSNSNGVVKINHSLDGVGSGKISILDASNNEDIRLSAQGDSWFNAGNVGIGTTGPSSPLTIKSNSVSSNDSALTIQGNSNTNAIFKIAEKSTDGARFHMYDGGVEKIAFYTDGTANHISAGNVGIGTTGPQTKLHVNGSIGAYTSDYATGSTGSRLLMKTFASTGNTYSLIQAQDVGGTSNNVLALQPYGDNVGIGTTSTSHKLDVSGGIFASNYISINAANTNFNLYNNGTTYLNGDTQVDSDFIVTNGDVGIGTTSPSVNFQVGDGTTDTSSRFYHNDNTYTQINGYGLYMSRFSSYIRPTTDNGKNLYIGTQDKQWLTVSQDASTHAFLTNGSESVRINSSGNVGIGTTNPAAILDVKSGMSAFETTLTNNNDWENSAISILERDNVGSAQSADKYSPNLNFHWSGRVSNSLWMNSSGHLNWGSFDSTGIPNAIGVFQTNTINLIGTGRITGVDTVSASTDAANKAYVDAQVGSADTLQEVTDNGNTTTNSIGIGTTSPSAKLHVADTNKAIDTEGNLFVTTTDTYAIDKGGQISLGGVWHSTPSTTQFAGIAGRKETAANGNAAGYLQLSTTNSSGGTLTEKMRITSAGKVGIGTTNPSEKLEVNGNLKISSIGTGNSASSYDLLFYGTTSSGTQTDQAAIHSSPLATNSNGGNLIFETSNTSNALAERMRIDGVGNVGIGTNSPSVNSRVTIHRSSDQLRLTDGSLAYVIGYDNSNLRFKNSAGDTHAVINWSTGNFGIGTTSPSSKLQVAYNGGHTSGNISLNHSALDIYNPLQASTDEKGAILTFSDHYQDANGYPRTIRAAIKGGTDTAGNTADGFLAFYTDSGGANSATERMRIDHDGNVGIGTTSPTSKLHISDTLTKTNTNPNTVEVFHNGNVSTNGIYPVAGLFTQRVSGGANSYATGLVGVADKRGNYGYIARGVQGIAKLSGNITINNSDMQYMGVEGRIEMEGSNSVNLDDRAYSFYGTAEIDSGSHLKEYHGLYLNAPTNNGTILNKYGISQVDANSINYFAGNVGIGTTSPAKTLDVSASGSNQGIYLNISGVGRLHMYADGSRNYFAGVSGNGHRFTTTGGANVEILNNGNVGIGTVSPSELLEVSSNTGGGSGTANPTTIRISDSGQGSAWDTSNSFTNLDFYSADSSGSGAGTKARVGAIAENSTGAKIGLAFSTTNTTDGISEKLRINATGKVGIGTTNPSQKLEINTNAASAIMLRARYNASYYTDYGSNQINFTGSSQSFDIKNNGSSALFINSSSNVGIGTTAPSYPLEVAGKGYFNDSDNTASVIEIYRGGSSNSNIKISNSDGYWAVGKASGGFFGISPDNLNTNAGSVFVIKTNGNVGIGTTNPIAPLDVDGNIYSNGALLVDRILSRGGSTDLKLDARSGYGVNVRGSGNASIAYFDYDSGSVGIGTTAPCAKLEVDGHFAATSKSFIIDHPTKEDKKLQYASLEGPENGVYVRGTTDKETIELPEYWSELVHEDSITVVLTPIGKKQDLFIIEKSNKLIKIGGAEGSFDYVVYGERKDIDKLEIEPLKV
jgi:hypothetical protein